MSNENLNEVTVAFNQGKAEAEKWVAQFTQNNQQIQIPVWGTQPASQLEYYYRKGFMDRFKEITKIDIEQEKKLSKKNHTLSIHKNGKPRPNALDREIKKLGPDFLAKYGDRFFIEIKNLSNRILNDLANANINVPDYEEYFKSDRLLDSLISVAKANANYHMFTAGAIHFYGANAEQSMQGLLPENYGPVEQRFYLYNHSNAQIYTILMNALVEFKQYLLSGIFNPETIHVAESTIWNKKLTMAARDPYAQRRL